MRWIRLLTALLSAKFKKKLTGTETVVKSFRVWITDIDVSVMNHAAIMTVLETGRLDAMVRLNFFKVASKNKWFFPSQAISIQFYRPLKVFQKAQIHTRISYVDEKWIYVEQKIERKGKIIAVCIIKNTIKARMHSKKPPPYEFHMILIFISQFPPYMFILDVFVVTPRFHIFIT